MDALKLQDKIYAGFAQAAKRLGLDNVQYRPAGSGNPLATAGATIKVSYNAEDMKYGKANKYGNPVWFGLFDGRLTQAGDYLVGPQGTFFIASQQLHLPIQCVECNARVTLSAPAAQSGVGAVGYGGPCGTDGDSVLLGDPGGDIATTGWPASILQFGQRERGVSDLPGAVQQIGWCILLPPSVPVVIQASYIISDDLGRRYAVQGAEKTDMGWRITSTELHA